MAGKRNKKENIRTFDIPKHERQDIPKKIKDKFDGGFVIPIEFANKIMQHFTLPATYKPHFSRARVKISGKIVQPMSLVSYLVVRDGAKCCCCGREAYCVIVHPKYTGGIYGFTWMTRDGQMLTADHIIPKSLGGVNRSNNMQVLCESCNTLKADKFPIDNEYGNAASIFMLYTGDGEIDIKTLTSFMLETFKKHIPGFDEVDIVKRMVVKDGEKQATHMRADDIPE